MKINLFTPNPPVGGSKLIFFTPFRGGANEENQFLLSGIMTDIHLFFSWLIKIVLQ